MATNGHPTPRTSCTKGRFRSNNRLLGPIPTNLKHQIRKSRNYWMAASRVLLAPASQNVHSKNHRISVTEVPQVGGETITFHNTQVNLQQQRPTTHTSQPSQPGSPPILLPPLWQSERGRFIQSLLAVCHPHIVDTGFGLRCTSSRRLFFLERVSLASNKSAK